MLALTDAAAGSAARASAVPAPAKAPAALLATTLLKAAKLSTVLPGVKGRQDDGGYAATYPTSSFVSEVETATPITKLRITLTAYGSKGAAAEGYVGQNRGLTKLPGVGQRAAFSLNQETLVLKGNQVLLVTVLAAPAGEDLIANGDKSAEVLDQVLGAPLLAATKALARHMNGAPAKKPYTHLPAGAYNPCTVTAASLKAKTKEPVVVTRSASDRPPAQQCDYSMNGRPFQVQTLTRAQAVSAAPALSLDSVFDTDLTSRNTRHNALTATIGPVRMFMIPDEDWVGEVEIASSPKGIPPINTTASTDAATNGHGLTLIRVLNGYTFTVNEEDCYALMSQEVLGRLAQQIDAIPVVSEAVTKKLAAKIGTFCQELTLGERG